MVLRSRKHPIPGMLLDEVEAGSVTRPQGTRIGVLPGLDPPVAGRESQARPLWATMAGLVPSISCKSHGNQNLPQKTHDQCDHGAPRCSVLSFCSLRVLGDRRGWKLLLLFEQPPSCPRPASSLAPSPAPSPQSGIPEHQAPIFPQGKRNSLPGWRLL